LRCYGSITRTRNVSEYMLVVALCLVMPGRAGMSVKDFSECRRKCIGERNRMSALPVRTRRQTRGGAAIPGERHRQRHRNQDSIVPPLIRPLLRYVVSRDRATVPCAHLSASCSARIITVLTGCRPASTPEVRRLRTNPLADSDPYITAQGSAKV